MAKSFQDQMSIIFHISIWISFAISRFVIIEEMDSAQLTITSVFLAWNWVAGQQRKGRSYANPS